MLDQYFENLQRKWFTASNPVNKKKASTTLGTGDNGVISITADAYGTSGNSFTVEVAIAEGANAAMEAELTGSDILVTLGTGVSAGVVDDTKNTAVLIAAAIAALDGVTATKSGTGADSLTAAVTKKSLSGGQWATPCKVKGTLVKDTNYYYVCTTAGSNTTTVWKRFALADY